MKPLACVAVVAVLSGALAARAQDNDQLTTSSEPGAVLDAIEARCRRDFDAQRDSGLDMRFCPVQHFLVLSKEDMCDLPLGLRQGAPEQWDEFVSDCLPRQMFGATRFTVDDFAFKRKIIEEAGEIYTADHEAVNINYMVEFCPGHEQRVSGMAYVGADKGSVVLITEYPPECLTP